MKRLNVFTNDGKPALISKPTAVLSKPSALQLMQEIPENLEEMSEVSASMPSHSLSETPNIEVGSPGSPD